jgi:8-oxo-dGTP pyrophosphatase MutT (NUDIX family)
MGKKASRTKLRVQYGAVPYRFSPGGEIEVLLITTRETRRWMIPKGWPIKKLSPVKTAMREAYEEAGVSGSGGPAVGKFQYLKVLRSGPPQLCEVEVFPLRVEEELDEWPEWQERERRWFKPREAADAVQEPSLRELLTEFAERIPAAGRDG